MVKLLSGLLLLVAPLHADLMPSVIGSFTRIPGTGNYQPITQRFSGSDVGGVPSVTLAEFYVGGVDGDFTASLLLDATFMPPGWPGSSTRNQLQLVGWGGDGTVDTADTWDPARPAPLSPDFRYLGIFNIPVGPTFRGAIDVTEFVQMIRDDGFSWVGFDPYFHTAVDPALIGEFSLDVSAAAQKRSAATQFSAVPEPAAWVLLATVAYILIRRNIAYRH